VQLKNVFIGTVFMVLTFHVGISGMDWRTFGFYKATYQSYRSNLFNPKNRSVEFLGYRKGPDYSFSQYLSLQADFLSLQWQIDVMGKGEYTDRWENDLEVKQFFFQRDLLENWILVAGRSIQRWGTGYAFNPTDVVAPEKELSDPDNTEKRAAGNDMVKLEYFGETYSVALCYLTKVDIGSKIRTEGSRLAFRYYKSLWDVDLSFISLFNKEEPPIWGLNFSSVIGERLEIHGEVSTQRGSYHRYHRAVREEEILYMEDPSTDFKRNDHRFYNQTLMGFQYTFPENILWVAEVYHQDQGYTKDEWDRMMGYLHFLNAQLDTPLEDLAEGNLLWCLNVFSPKGAMRDYLMNYLDIPIHENVELRTTWLINIHDFSQVFIPEIKITLGNRFTFYSRSFIFQGRDETEFGELFESYATEGGVRFRL
jgi:hypothetical protein